MFEIQIKEGLRTDTGALILLKRVIESISELVDNAEIKATERGLSFQVMDAPHICLVDIFLANGLFDLYRCDRDIVLGVKVKPLSRILKNIKISGDGLLSMNSDDTAESLSLLYQAEAYALKFSIKLYSFDTNAYTFPDMDYVVDLNMSTDVFLTLAKTIGSFGDDYVTIHAHDNRVDFYQTSDFGSSRIEIRNHENGTSVVVTEPIKKEIPMKYIGYISRTIVIPNNIRICIGISTPIVFYLSLEKGGYLKFYVAPKA